MADAQPDFLSRCFARSHPPISYGEDSSSDADELDSSASSDEADVTDSDADADATAQAPGKKPLFPSHSRPQPTRNSTKVRRSPRGSSQTTLSSFQVTKRVAKPDAKGKRPPSRGQVNTSKKQRISVSQEAEEVQDITVPDEVIPNWRDARISYGVWTDIFYYAAISDGYDTLNVNWLIDAATTCREFSEAALTAIYRSPPITTPGKAKRLAALLERPASETRLNYRVKIESIWIDVAVVPQNVLYKIIHHLPRLRELVFFTQHDQPPYRELDRTVRWHFTEDIFQALGPSTHQAQPNSSSEALNGDEKPYPTMLRSWEWSEKLLGGPVPSPMDIIRIHQGPSFARLTRLSFTNFQVPSLYKARPKSGDDEQELALYNEDGAVIQSIADAISQLECLKHLVFESSTVMNHRMLPLLPKGLVHLGLINCWEVRSDDLESFLGSHGRELRTLSLLHNQSLDMGFLTSLADTCPKLEELRMNLSYFRHHNSVSLVNNDADPLYEHALLPDQIPKWPASLRIIDFEHIRHWNVEAAEMFLQSLIDSAGSLPNLRHLAVKTMLNIPWKARANMRHEWRKKLDRIFLRAFEPPMKHTSLRQPPAKEEKEEVVHEPAPQEKHRRKRPSHADEPCRRSTRIAAQVSDSDSRNSSNSKPKGLRGNIRSRPTYRDPDTDEDEFDLSEDEDKDEEMTDADAKPQDEAEEPVTSLPVVQGRCTTVAIVFDNQKPTELQFGMDDFMDEDRDESDGEWDGDQDDDDGVYAW
ncbi:hypothetical protein B0T10DRAFT_532351 [Thelonectria olida]|uniref:Uncharacterized protein n=1 Tax=Thelonectria olida TaxID=1576542 RepID=A0A9P8VVL2_9HYPO|nr:hypothetical protein B0T10DRAFT_532351 [Thelonectria olida]